MKAKLAKKRAEGRGGWDDPEQCSAAYLSYLLIQHCFKGDPLDVGNFAMMLHQRGDRIVIDDETASMARAAIPGALPVEPVGYLKPDFAHATEPKYIPASERVEIWAKEVFTVPVYASPPLSREGEDSAEVDRLRGLLDIALEALNTYADPTSYLDNDGEPLPADAETHEGILAAKTIAVIRSALAATRSRSAATAKGGEHG